MWCWRTIAIWSPWVKWSALLVWIFLGAPLPCQLSGALWRAPSLSVIGYLSVPWLVTFECTKGSQLLKVLPSTTLLHFLLVLSAVVPPTQWKSPGSLFQGLQHDQWCFFFLFFRSHHIQTWCDIHPRARQGALDRGKGHNRRPVFRWVTDLVRN